MSKKRNGAIQSASYITFALFFITVLAILLQLHLVSVLIDAVDPQYLNPDMYSTTFQILMDSSDIVLALTLTLFLSKKLYDFRYRLPFRINILSFLIITAFLYVAVYSVWGDFRRYTIDQLVENAMTETKRQSGIVALNQMALVLEGVKFDAVNIDAKNLSHPDNKIGLLLSPLLLYLSHTTEQLENTYPSKVDVLFKTFDEESVIEKLRVELQKNVQEYCDSFNEVYNRYVSETWKGIEKIKGFTAIASVDELSEEAAPLYFRAIQKEFDFGTAILPGLTREQFVTHIDTQRIIKEQIQQQIINLKNQQQSSDYSLIAQKNILEALENTLQGHSVAVDPCYLDSYLVNKITGTLKPNLKKEILRALNPATTTLGRDGEHSQYGFVALKTVSMPTFFLIVLSITTIGLCVSLSSIINDTLFGGKSWTFLLILIPFFAFIIFAPFSSSNRFSEQDAVHDILTQIEDQYFPGADLPVLWVLKGTPLLYQSGVFVRNVFFRGTMLGLEKISEVSPVKTENLNPAKLL